MNTKVDERKEAIHLLRSGRSVPEVAAACERSNEWVYKWWKRYQAEGWSGLADRSHAPKRHGTKLTKAMEQAVLRARSELEAEAASGKGLKYVGAQAVRTRLRKKRIKQLPSRATIERVLSKAGMTRPKAAAVVVKYPHLQPKQPQQLIQIDIVPHFLTGGMRVPCFNAIDVVSRYPTGQAYAQRRAEDAATFLIQVWQEIGIPQYTQVDNEGCFSGGATHAYVLGQVVRLALWVGTELLFSPVYHPKSNGSIERFHQDYNQHVWQDTYLHDLTQVRQKAKQFFVQYRHSAHQVALEEQTPAQVHTQTAGRRLAKTFVLPNQKLPLYAGRIHFLRRINPDQTVSVLNVTWPVGSASSEQGVWVTLALAVTDATLAIYDRAPDNPARQCLACHDFPLTEPVLPYPPAPNQPLGQAPLPSIRP